MNHIIKKDGFVYLVEGEKKGFETFYNLGKDQDYWENKEKIENDEKPKKVKTKKEED